MPSCTVDNCCCCIELRTGCLIIGYLNLVAEIALIIMCLLGLTAGAVISAEGEEQKDKDTGTVVVAIAAVFLLIVLFFFAFTIVLLVGVHKGKRGHVKAYLIVAVICVALSFITFLASFAGHVTVGDIISKLLSIALSVYFIVVIRSYYYKMDERKPTVYNTA